VRDERSTLSLSVYEALERRAVDGEACVPIVELARICTAGETDVRQALRRLTAAGDIVAAGKRNGRTRIWRLPALTPQGERADAARSRGAYGDPGLRDLPRSSDPIEPDGSPDAAASVGGDALRTGQPVANPDDEPGEEELAWRRRVGLRYAYAFLDRFGPDEIGEPDQPGGECGQCHREARRRYSLGMFVLCRECRMSRAKAALKAVEPLPGDKPEPEPEPEPELVVIDAGLELVDELADRLAQNGSGDNGNRRSALWDEPDF
jgi:ribosomal protein L37AE/L43A